MTAKNRILHFLLLSFYLTTCATLTASPTNAPNSHYSNAGIATLDMTPYFGTGTTTLSPSIFTVTVSRTQSSTNYRFGVSIQSINYQITNNKLNYTIVPSGANAATSADLAFYTNNANKIATLKVSYIIIEPLFGSYYFSYRWLTPNRIFRQTTHSSYTEVSVTEGPFNTSKTYTLWITILGVDATLAANNQIDLYPSASITAVTSITYLIQTISPVQFYLANIVMMAFIYDASELQSLTRSATLTVAAFGSTNTASLTTTEPTNSIRSYNTIIGIVGFHIVSLGYLQFTTTITPNNVMKFISSYTFSYVNFNYLFAIFDDCVTPTPYLDSVGNLCYDVCPVRYSTDSNYYECTICPTYDCYQCYTSGLCSVCSSDVDFRTMNTTTSRCVPLDGYYDDGSSSQAVACNASACLTCSSQTFCLSCQTGKYLTALNACANCIANCQSCVNGTSCTNCSTGYTYFSSNSTCVINCATGQYASASTTCSSCIANCQSCSNATSCTQCNTGYTYSAANNTCFLNCSTITNCLTCSYSSSLNCNSCSTGYEVSSNICAPNCGDGDRIGNESCDDSNIANGDGCSSICKIQSNYFCNDILNGSLLLSVCGQCSSNCQICINSTFCSTCSSGYSIVASGITAVCSQSCVANCNLCSSGKCIGCVGGFTLGSDLTCKAVCGDGVLVNGQSCDDGNSANGDGCSDVCLIQANFVCATNGSISVCNLVTLAIDYQSAVKDEFSNSVYLSFKITPLGASGLNKLSWSTIASQTSNLALSFSAFSYDSSSGYLQISALYQQTLSDHLLTMQFAFPNSAPFSLLGTKSSSVTLSASNNLALWVYESSEYLAASYLKSVVLGLTLFAVMLFVLGYYSGKLIALELLSILQLTYFSLLTVQNLSPGFLALKNLSYSNGYSLTLINSTRITGKLSYYLNYDINLLNNFNLNLILWILPLILVLFGTIFSIGKSKADQSQPQNFSRFFRGQFVFYGIIASLYSLVMPLAIITQNFASLGILQIGFLMAGALLVPIILIYNCLIRKFPQFFGEFVECIESAKTWNYYYFLQFQRFMIGCLLVFLANWQYQTLVIISILIIKLLILIKKKPYTSNGGNLRPFLNNITQLMIVAIFYLYDLMGTKTFEFQYYAPFLIVGHLLIAVGYNFYFFVKNMKKKRKERGKVPKISDFQAYDQRGDWKNKWSYSKGQQSVSKIL